MLNPVERNWKKMSSHFLCFPPEGGKFSSQTDEDKLIFPASVIWRMLSSDFERSAHVKDESLSSLPGYLIPRYGVRKTVFSKRNEL